MKSLKVKVSEFVVDLIHQIYIDNEVLSPKFRHYYFTLDGFVDAPEVFMVATEQGVSFGSGSFIWETRTIPVPIKHVTHKLEWALLNELDSEERKDLIVEEMLKAIASKKREYWTCQLCDKKIHRTEFYDKKTCIPCAENKLRKYKIY